MKKRIFFLVSFVVLCCWGCPPAEQEIIMTVTGPVPANEMGLCLSHEHVLVDFIGADSTGYHRWDKQEAAQAVLPHLKEILDYGVRTFVECTPAYLGRDPWLLKSLSEETGLHLMTNTGYYGAHNNRFVPAFARDLTAEELSALWVEEFESGIEDSGVRPGFIKIAVDGADTLSKLHHKIISAAALAHQQTGMVIASHTGPDAPAFAQIAVLRSHDVDPSVFIWVHAQRGSLEGNIKAGRLGAWISLDNVNLNRKPGSGFDVQWYADRIEKLKQAGLLHRVLLSHDAGWYKPEEADGGTFRGFTGLFTHLLPMLKSKGFSEDEVEQLLVRNPREAFRLKHVKRSRSHFQSHHSG